MALTNPLDTESATYEPLGLDRSSLEEGVKRTTNRRRRIALVLGGFGLLAVAAVVGVVYAMPSGSVATGSAATSSLATAGVASSTIYSDAPHVVKGAGVAAAAGWTKMDSSLPEMVSVTFGIKSKNAAQLEKLFWAVSDPKSTTFQQYLSRAELKELIYNAEGLQRVTQWLDSYSVQYTVSDLGDYVTVKTTPAMAEHLLKTRVALFKNDHTGRTDVASSSSFSVPDIVADDIDMIAGATTLPVGIAPRPLPTPVETPKLRTLASSSQDTQTTPAFLNRVYNIKSNTVTNKGATQSIFESLGQQYSPDDLTQFCKYFNISPQKFNHQVGDNDPSVCEYDQNSCGEANLDAQYMLAIAQGADSTYWSVPGDEEPFLSWLQAVAATENPPLVHSVSYGGPEHLQDATVMKKFDEEAKKLGVRGVTVVVSSGDDGVAGFEARNGEQYCGFNPSFPASSPYVTAVGATQFTSSEEEIAQSSSTGGRITTGGGFSDAYDMPSYQKEFVQEYLSTGPNLPPKSKFASSGRGFPDIALSGHSYQVVIGGQMAVVDGTSASSPVFAALLTLVNSERLDAGKKPLGFVNPLLYSLRKSNPEAFSDVTSGENNCAAGGTVCCQYGFTAGKGWDPLTGLGSVNFDKLRALMVAA